MADDDIQVAGTSEEDLRKQAISDSDSFWPIWVIGGWGLGLAFQAYDTYGRKSTVSESQVSEEMNRIRGG
jgi:2TM domain